MAKKKRRPVSTIPPNVHLHRRIREMDVITNASDVLDVPIDIRHDRLVAIDDERADGAVRCVGITADGNHWSGTLFRRIPLTPHDTEEPQVSADGSMAVLGPAEDNGGDAEAPGQGEQGEPDELEQLIHAIAGGRDAILTEELGKAVRERIDERFNELAAGVNDRLIGIAESGLDIKTVVQVQDLPPVTLPDGELVHRDLALVLALVRSGTRNVMLVGPAGCGKTTLARQVATALQHDRFAALSCSPGMSEAKVLGRIGVPTETNPTGYYETAVMVAFRDGGTILFDEMDNADASMMVSFNAMTDGGFATLPTGATVQRHPETVVLAACNTFGHGADRLYVGRNQLDAATLDRFVGATVEMDYDRDLERTLCPEQPVRDLVWGLRDNARKSGLRRVVSTRAVLAARRLHGSLQMPLKEVAHRITLGWSKSDRLAVGVS